MTIPAVETFADNLRRSNLLSPDRLSQLDQMLARPDGVTDARRLALELTDRGWLTAWQAGMVLSGRDAFFLGRYKLLDQLGEGGMGTVFRAEQTPLGRVVALKVMSSELLKDSSAVARFHREIQAAAALAHPNVVTAFDAESVGDSHFLVMEYVAGKDLNRFACDYGRLPAGWACECIRQAALGLEHAHERGMVHRDIKPANLLVTSPLAHGPPTVKILDLGLARFVSESTDDGGLTGIGQVMGTPDYIAPEQTRDTHAADIRSDIFSLGCTLFRLLAGRAPFEGRTVVEKLMVRTTRDAPRLATLRPEVPAGLDAVVAQMMARDPARRYQTPLEAARALAPYCQALGSFPEEAAPTAIVPAIPRPEVERTSVFEPTNPTFDKFLKTLAHSAVEEALAPLTQSIAASAARSDTAALPGRPAEAARAASRERPQKSRRRAIAFIAAAAATIAAVGWGAWLAFARGTLVLDWKPADRDGGQLTLDDRPVPLPSAGAIRIDARPGGHRLELLRPGYEPLELVADARRGAETTLALDWKPKPATRRRHDWQALQQELPDPNVALTTRPPAQPLAAKLHDFRLRWPGSDDALSAARELARFEWPLDRLSAAGLPETERFAWHPTELVTVFGQSSPMHTEPVAVVAYRPDGRQVATSGGDGLIRLWDPATMRQTAEIPRGTSALAYTPDSRHLIAGGPEVVFYDVTVREPAEKFTLSEFEGPVRNAVISPDGQRLVLIDSKVRLFDLADLPPKALSSFAVESFGTGAAFTPDSRTLITFSGEKTIKLWNLASDKPPELRARLEAHGAPASGDYICGVVVSEDGRTMVSSGVWDWNLLTWDLQPIVPKDPLGFHFSTAPSVITRSPDGKLFAVGCWDGAVYLFDLTANAPPPLVALKGHAGQVWGAAFSPDSRQLVSGGNEGALRVWDIDGAESHEHEFPRVGHTRLVSGVSFAADGSQLFSTGHDGRTIVWNVAERRPLRELPRVPGAILASALSPDGRVLAVGDQERAALRLVDTTTGETRHAFHGIPSPATFRFSPDGRRIAAPVGVTVRSWDVAEGAEFPPVGESSRPIAAFAILPDSRSLVAAINTAVFTPRATSDVQRWEISTGKKLQQFAGDNASYGVMALDCSPDGKTVAAALQPTGLMLWDAAGRATHVAGQAYSALAFSPDGRRLVTLDARNSFVMLCHPGTGAEIQSWRLASQPQSLTFSPDSRHLALGNANGTICILRVD